MLEDPAITNAQRLGYPRPESHRPHCPYCGEEAYELYLSIPTGSVLGCEKCLKLKDAFELEERGLLHE